MSIPLRVLILEDNPADAELMVHELRRAGFDPDWCRMETETDYSARLDLALDIILADYYMPQFDALRALYLLQERGLDIPLIVVSGSIGEDIAVAAMKQGATDYVLKDRMARLGQAVIRALELKQLREEKQRAKEALQESQHSLEAVIETAPSLIVLTDPDGGILLFNRACEELTGYKREEVLGKTIPELFLPPEWVPIVKRRFADPYAPEVRAPHENPWITKSGEVRFIEWRCTALPSPKDGRPRILGTGNDVTERKRAEEALGTSIKQWHATFDAIGDPVWLSDLEGKIQRCNVATTNLLGKPFSDILGRPCYELIHHTKERIEGCPTVRMQETHRRETVVLPRDDRWFSSAVDPLLDEGGRLIGAVHIMSDITERKQVEKSLQELKDFHESILLNMGEGMVVEDAQGYVTFVNPAGASLLGCDVEELVGKHWTTLVPPDQHPIVEATHERRRRRESHRYELQQMRKDGMRFPSLVSGSPRFEKGRFVGTIALFTDISELKQAEDALKSAALETLDAVSTIVEANDPYTAGHSAKVTQIALELAREMGLGADQLNTLRITGPLHDLGKVGIPGSVLNKPTKLTQAEWVMIEAHPVMSAQTANRVAAFNEAVPIIRHHHERWDGTGYPDRLEGEKIPLLARILAVADGFEAMTSDRPYRSARTQEQALAELEKCAGTQWDPQVVKALLKLKRPTKRKAKQPHPALLCKTE